MPLKHEKIALQIFLKTGPLGDATFAEYRSGMYGWKYDYLLKHVKKF